LFETKPDGSVPPGCDTAFVAVEPLKNRQRLPDSFSFDFMIWHNGLAAVG
jgi:hypothetical protein